MKQIIDHAADLTGWSITAGSTLQLNEYQERIAGLNSASILAFFSSTAPGSILSKSFTAIDVSEMDTLILSAVSSDYGSDNFESLQFSYKIKINDTDEYFLPVSKTFTDINIALDGVDQIDRIEITALHGSDDYLWISEILAEKENVALDMMISVKEHIEAELQNVIGDGILVGESSGSAGDISIQSPASRTYDIEQYSVIQISDGVNSEIHQIDDKDRVGGLTFMKTFDGKTLKHDYTDAEIKIMFPVYINPDETEIRLPGIVVWGFVPTPIYRTGKLGRVIMAYKTDGSFIEQGEGQLMTIPIQIDCQARRASLLDLCARAVRRWLEKEIVWVNGRFHELDWVSPAIETQPPSGIDIIPKVQYNLDIETKEYFDDRIKLVPTDTVGISVNIGRS